MESLEKPLRIALLTLKFSPLLGGDVTHVLHLARFLSEQGVETDIITIRPKLSGRDFLGKNLRIRRLGFSATTTELERVGLKRALYMTSSFLVLLGCLFEDRLDLIHAHGWDPALVGGLFSRMFGIPLVLTVHGIPRPRRQMPRMIFQFLEKMILGLCCSRHSRIIALTNSDRIELIELGVGEEQIDVIPNGIDVHEFDRIDPGGFREDHGIPSDAFLALFVGRLHEQKGVDTLLRAAKNLEAKNVHFVLVGSGHKEKEYRSFAEKLHIENVCFAGEVEREVLLSAFASCDVFVLPSIFEGMPYVALEAMAAGRPVVASRIPGLAEIIQDGKNGLLFEKTDDKDLARVILSLEFDREKTREMGEAGRRLVEKEFDWKKIFYKLAETYRGLLGEDRAKRGLEK